MIDYKDFILIEDKNGFVYPKYHVYCNQCGQSRGYIKPYKGCEERGCRSCGNKGELSEEHKESIRNSVIEYYKQNKMLLYYAQIHTNQLEHDENRKIVKTVTINLLDFEYLKSNEYHKKILIKDNFENKKASEILELHVIELPKFKNGIANITHSENTPSITPYLKSFLSIFSNLQ